MQNRLEINTTANRRSTSTGREAGFTVIEIAVGVVIFTIVMGAIYGLLRVARSGKINTNQRAEVLQNARIAINTMSRDVINSGVGYPNLGATMPDNRLAGLLGGTADEDTDLDVITPVFARDALNDINGVKTDQVTFLFIDDTFNSGTSLPISVIDTDGDTVELSEGYDNSACQAGDVYIITGQNGSALGMLQAGEEEEPEPEPEPFAEEGEEDEGASKKVVFATGDPLLLNNPGESSPISKIQAPASLQRVSWVSYFLTPEDGNGTGTGTLVRRVYGGSGETGWVDQPLAFGIENLQIQYVLITGAVVDVPAANQMDDIRQVLVSVTVRSPDIDPNTNEPFRSTLTTTISARNLVYEKI